MEIHQLQYFLAVSSTGSFTEAADICYVSQPSLSAQIAKLEDELGGALFERSRKGSRLTARGELFRHRAQEILNQVEAAKSEQEELNGMVRGKIVLGCLPTTGAFILPQLLKAYREKYPNIDVLLREGSSPVLQEELLNFNIELAIMDEAGMVPQLEAQVLFSEPLYIALPPGHDLCAKKEIDLKDLEGASMVLMRKNHGFHRIVMAALDGAHVSPKVVYESSEIETVQSLVKAELGLSIVPKMICVHDDLEYRPIKEPAPSRTLLIAYRQAASLTPAALAMKDLALEILGV